jgi:hypothetical protein
MPCLVFVHIPKTAGTTLRGVILWKYRHQEDHVIQLYGDRPSEELQRMPAQVRNRARMVIGHFSYGIHKYFSQECTYLTILRDPVERVLASFRWMIRRPGHPYYDPRKRDLGLEAFVSNPEQKGSVENGQTRLIAGVESEDVDVSEKHLHTATRNLEHFVLAGLTERFDESLLLLHRNLGWRNPFYVTRNTSPDWTRRIPVSAGTIEMIRASNQLDYDLYEFASGMLNKSIQRHGRSFERDLRLYGMLNRPINAVGSHAEGIIRAYARSPLVRLSTHLRKTRCP